MDETGHSGDTGAAESGTGADARDRPRVNGWVNPDSPWSSAASALDPDSDLPSWRRPPTFPRSGSTAAPDQQAFGRPEHTTEPRRYGESTRPPFGESRNGGGRSFGAEPGRPDAGSDAGSGDRDRPDGGRPFGDNPRTRRDDGPARPSADSAPGTARPFADLDGAGTARPFADLDRAGAARPFADLGAPGTARPFADLDGAGSARPFADLDSAGTARPFADLGGAGTARPLWDTGRSGGVRFGDLNEVRPFESPGSLAPSALDAAAHPEDRPTTGAHPDDRPATGDSQAEPPGTGPTGMRSRYADLIAHLSPPDDDRRPAEPLRAADQRRDDERRGMLRPVDAVPTPSSAPPYPYEGDLEDAPQPPSAARQRTGVPVERPVYPTVRSAAPTGRGSAPESARHALTPNTPPQGTPTIGERTAPPAYDPLSSPRRLRHADTPAASYPEPGGEQAPRSLPQRVPAQPDVPTAGEPASPEPTAEAPALARIATHLRRGDVRPVQERQEGFDVNAILAAVREVAGVRDASLRTTPAGAHSLRLDLSEGADPAEVSRQVARLLQDRMGLDAAMQGTDGAAAGMPSPPAAPPSSQPGALSPGPLSSGALSSGALSSGSLSPGSLSPGPLASGSRVAHPQAPVAPSALPPATLPPTAPTPVNSPPATAFVPAQPSSGGRAQVVPPPVTSTPMPAPPSSSPMPAPPSPAAPTPASPPTPAPSAPMPAPSAPMPAAPTPVPPAEASPMPAPATPALTPNTSPPPAELIRRARRPDSLDDAPAAARPDLPSATETPTLVNHVAPMSPAPPNVDPPTDRDPTPDSEATQDRRTGSQGSSAVDPSADRSPPPAPSANRTATDNGSLPDTTHRAPATGEPTADTPPRDPDQGHTSAWDRPTSPNGHGRIDRDNATTTEPTPTAKAPEQPSSSAPTHNGTDQPATRSETTTPPAAVECAPPRPLDIGERPGPRVTIENVQVNTFGTEATVEVRLGMAGRVASGTATGPAVDGYLLRLCATATAQAVDDLLASSDHRDGPARCYVEHASSVSFGSTQVAVVVMLLSCGGWVEQLAGSAVVSGDDNRHAMVRATLAAVNRRLEALLS